MGCDSNGNGEADTKPFSIRQFVFATRRKDILYCWPFPQKYLQICLKHSISNVLPPFEPCNADIKTTETVGLTGSQQDKDNASFEHKVREIIVQEKLIKDESKSYEDYKVLMASAGPSHDCLTSHDLDSRCKHKDESNLSSDHIANVIVPLNHQSSSIQGSDDLNAYPRIHSVWPQRLRLKKRKYKGRRKKRSMLEILAEAKPCTLENFYTYNWMQLNKPCQ